MDQKRATNLKLSLYILVNTTGFRKPKASKAKGFLLQGLGHNLSLFPSPLVALPYGSTQRFTTTEKASIFKMHPLLCSRGSGA